MRFTPNAVDCAVSWEPRREVTYQTLVEVPLDDGTATRDSLESFTESLPATTSEEVRKGLPEKVADRYERRDLLGKGGMGEVWRVWDVVLERPVALKVVHGSPSPRTWQRFEEEARVTARLQHPGIVPVHDFGRLEDGRLWFTMKVVQGRTLGDLIQEAHKDWRLGRQGAWTFRRLLEGFRRVCETVAYAHARGVVHRDLKPSNIMFGAYGEISVLDWGIAKVLGSADEDEGLEARETQLTQVGAVSGTPNYMSPEQAQGRSSEVGPEADVYALGASLYDLLADRPPRVAKHVRQLLMQTAIGNPPIQPPSVHRTGAPVDEALDALVLAALVTDEEERTLTAAQLAKELADWLDGARKRERALELVAEADQSLAEAVQAREDATQLEEQAGAALEGVAENAPIEDKLPGWELEDAAETARLHAEERSTHALLTLRAALSHAPNLSEAHERLANLYADAHRRAEADGDDARARTAAAELAQHDRDGRFADYLAGTGRLTLVTEVPARARLFRFVEQERRLQPVFERDLGTTPLREVPLPMGSYLIELEAPGRAPVKYPVWIRRQEHWDGIAPGESEPRPIPMPAADELGPDDVYVPPGWCWIGEDEFAHTLPLTRVWCEAFVIKRFPVTIGEYVDFLNAVLEEQGEAAAMELVPRAGGHVIYERDDADRFVGLAAGLPGLEELPRRLDLPATAVSWEQAMGYLAWSEAGAWRLPTQSEWQRAARGSDQRDYPWGSRFEPSWCNMRRSHTAPTILAVGTFPSDVSVFGVRGMAGNVADWSGDTTLDALQGATGFVRATSESTHFAVGGCCSTGIKQTKLAQRTRYQPRTMMFTIGFRMARSL